MNINLFQANSLAHDDVDDFRRDKILGSVYHGVKEYIKYIEKSIEVVNEKSAIEIKVSKVDEEHKDSTSNEHKYILNLDNLSDRLIQTITTEVFQKEVDLFKKRASGNWRVDKGNLLEVVERNSEENYLLLKDVDEELEAIWLKADVYQLKKQKEALQRLQNQPLPFHGSLQRLFDLSDKSKDYFVGNFDRFYGLRDSIDWQILDKPDEYDGTHEQQDFVLKALCTNDFALLEGPPGSGKTTAICELIIQLAKQGKRVLLVSATHVAVDNVIHRILTTYKDKCAGLISPIRIASNKGSVQKESVLPHVLKDYVKSTKEQLRSNLNKFDNTESINYLKESLKNKGGFDDIILKSANFIGGTMIGVLQHPSIKNRDINEVFDVMIVDEASKVTFTEFLVPALYAKKWILVGDVQQLSPYTEDDFINESIDSILNGEDKKRSLVSSFDLKRKLILGNKRDKESVKVFFYKKNEEFYLDDERQYSICKLSDIENTFTKNFDKAFWELNGADVIVAQDSKKHRNILRDFLKVKAQFFEGRIRNEDLIHLQNAFHKNEGRNKQKNPIYSYEFVSDSKQEWKELVGTRLSQMYQYRFSQNLNSNIKSELDFLVPEDLGNDVESLRRVALPSILELLQIGVGEKSYVSKSTKKRIKEEKLIYEGFNQFEEIKENKFQTLSYQHRMHDDIAVTSREHFYEGNLQTSDKTLNRKDKLSFYRNNEPKVIWVPNNQKGHSDKIVNRAEVNDIKKELELFVKKARSENEEYEIAVLTFYRQQEIELRNMLRQLCKQKTKFKNFKIQNVKITLCTVDKFQGDEADMVLLCFTKHTRRAFYNSPNRLNVALTRARYKMVLFGNQKWLAKNAQLEAVRSLATNMETRLKH